MLRDRLLTAFGSQLAFFVVDLLVVERIPSNMSTMRQQILISWAYSDGVIPWHGKDSCKNSNAAGSGLEKIENFHMDVPQRVITTKEITTCDLMQDWLNEAEISFTSGMQSMSLAKILSDLVKCDPRVYCDTDEGGE